jgi:integrase
LPITEAARKVLAPMLDRAKALGTAWIFASDDEHRLAPETVTVEVRYVSASMFVAGEAKSDFQLRDLRRTCETQLAAMGVSRDLRARLLSHGLTGVQHKHYDRHDYRDELRAVLERWTLRLTGAEGAVVPIGKRKRKA